MSARDFQAMVAAVRDAMQPDHHPEIEGVEVRPNGRRSCRRFAHVVFHPADDRSHSLDQPIARANAIEVIANRFVTGERQRRADVLDDVGPIIEGAAKTGCSGEGSMKTSFRCTAAPPRRDCKTSVAWPNGLLSR